MPSLTEMSDDADDEPPIPAWTSPHSKWRKTHGKIPLWDRTIVENVQSEISRCAHQLLPSPDRLQETKSTLLQCHAAVNKIMSQHLDIVSLKSTVLTLMDNLEVHWLALSSLVPDNRPLEYLTGKIQTFLPYSRAEVLLLEHHFRSSIHDCSHIVQLMVFISIWFIGIVGGSWSHGDFLVALLSMGLLKRNKVRTIPTWNRTFRQGIVSDHCAVKTCANDIILTAHW